ncbi:uncharacterized protein LOC131181345 [Hevea brasiliensis]|uniref:uncharacterized protein LOC131181345 n=1 Tax=Hevea brasiliensis TaxID=3981 RepID=UPI0025DFC4F1|nr:uncharacterized protein LOC131181345 [Hevea brasiliensis]
MITDNILMAFEVIHHMRRKTRGNRGEVALKIDISKAYDCVDWFFLSCMMRKMGLAQRWINLTMMYVSSIKHSMAFNGHEIRPIIPRRGLRQGDLLSPYLFIICVEDCGTDCRDGKKMMNSYLWGLKRDGNRGIHWLAWDKMWSRKDSGDMGLRNLHLFKIAMLRK